MEKARVKDKRKAKTSYCIIDSQSVSNSESAEERGCDPNKKRIGIKRHIAVDTNGLPHGVYVTTANENDKTGAIKLIWWNMDSLSEVKKFLFDGGYEGEAFALRVKDEHGADVEIVKRSDVAGFTVMPKRWVVERSFAWLGNYRRLWKNCERKLDSSLQMVLAAFVAVLLYRF